MLGNEDLLDRSEGMAGAVATLNPRGHEMTNAETIAGEVIAAATSAADDIRARAQQDAEDIRARAQQDAEDIVAAARQRIQQERAVAEGRAAERIDAAEHEALEIRRNAYRLAQADVGRRASSEEAAAESEARGRRERELLALAIGTVQHAERALDEIAALVASESADFARFAATLQVLIGLASEPARPATAHGQDGRPTC